MTERRRWDTDERLVGVADASRATRDVEQMLAMTRGPGWVTEDALAHLGPWCTKAASDLGIEIDLRVSRDDQDRGPRVDAYGLIGAFAEGATYVRESRSGGDVVLDVVTGVMPGDNAFATHGHLARIRIVGS